MRKSIYKRLFLLVAPLAVFFFSFSFVHAQTAKDFTVNPPSGQKQIDLGEAANIDIWNLPFKDVTYKLSLRNAKGSNLDQIEIKTSANKKCTITEVDSDPSFKPLSNKARCAVTSNGTTLGYGLDLNTNDLGFNSNEKSYTYVLTLSGGGFGGGINKALNVVNPNPLNESNIITISPSKVSPGGSVDLNATIPATENFNGFTLDLTAFNLGDNVPIYFSVDGNNCSPENNFTDVWQSVTCTRQSNGAYKVTAKIVANITALNLDPENTNEPRYTVRLLDHDLAGSPNPPQAHFDIGASKERPADAFTIKNVVARNPTTGEEEPARPGSELTVTLANAQPITYWVGLDTSSFLNNSTRSHKCETAGECTLQASVKVPTEITDTYVVLFVFDENDADNKVTYTVDLGKGVAIVPTIVPFPALPPCKLGYKNVRTESGQIIRRNVVVPTPPTKAPVLPENPTVEQIEAYEKEVAIHNNAIPIYTATLNELDGCLVVNTAFGDIFTDPARFVESIMGFLLGISGGIALLLIIRSGYEILSSKGDPEKVGQARERLTSAIVGLLFLIFSLVILEVIGVDILRLPGLCAEGDFECRSRTAEPGSQDWCAIPSNANSSRCKENADL